MLDLLRQHVLAAAARAEVRDAVAQVYAELEREIAVRRPVCAASGRCCRFDEYGHRLYVTTMELAAFVSAMPTTPQPTSQLASWDGSGCPFQVAKLCSVHGIRPFGCRVFFCDASSTAWQHERYEQFHAHLKRLHGQLNVPYLYVEWRQALAALGLAADAASASAQHLSRA